MRARPVRDLALAVGFLTVLPVGREWPEGGAPDAVGYYAWVGWLLGGIGWLAWWALRAAGAFADSTLLVGGALIVALWALLTRMLHWDGLADTADGLWGAYEPARRLEIMRDSRIGSFGATALVLAAILQVTAAGGVLVLARPWVLVAAPVLARASASLAAWTLAPAREEGLGLTAMRRPSLHAVAACLVAVLALLVLGHLTAPAVAFFATLAIGVAAGLLLPRVLAGRVGGMTGDLFGATIVGVETIVLVAGVLLP